MQKDLKIGMIAGFVIVIIAVVWLSMLPSLSTKARLMTANKTGTHQNNYSPSKILPALQTQPQNTPDQTKYQQPEKIQTQKFHIVIPGQTLSGISKIYYGSPGKVKKILDANPDIKNPDSLTPGSKLIIPQ